MDTSEIYSVKSMNLLQKMDSKILRSRAIHLERAPISPRRTFLLEIRTQIDWLQKSEKGEKVPRDSMH